MSKISFHRDNLTIYNHIWTCNIYLLQLKKIVGNLSPIDKSPTIFLRGLNDENEKQNIYIYIESTLLKMILDRT